MSRRLLIACGAALALGAGAARADTLVVCTEASPDALSSALSTANTSFDVSEQISDRLVEMEIGGSALKPALAESWTISEDGLQYTFKLRHGVKWQSSATFKPTRALNADDVVFSFNRMLDRAHRFNKVGGGNYPLFAALVEPSLKAVTKVSDDTVLFELKTPLAPLLSTLSVQPFSIQSAEYAAAMDKAGTPDQLDIAPIGTGPFQLVQYQKDSLIRFRAFKDFWGANGGMPERAAKVDNLVFSITPDPSVRFAKLRANECQVARYPNPADLDAMRATAGVTVQDSTIASLSYLAFRNDKKPFDDKRVREALATAIDLNSLVKAVYQGSGTPAAALVSPALWGHNDQVKPRPYDPARAKALLAEAGYPNGFSTDLWAIPVARAYMPNGRRAAEMIQADWAKIGVTAKIVTFEWGEYLRRIRNNEADVGMLGGTWDYPDPSQQLIGFTCEALTTGRNIPHWCNRTYSDLIQRANIVTSQAERARLYQQAQQVFHDEVPAMVFADARAFVGVRNNVRGFKLHFLGGQPFGGVSLAQ
ncbi:ABC transporter substrate-binding protein [Limobrevibacterium gyesilva]|uniref:ABC transporter substrate-binding protein n=1 Tax=Limobrevibacterium gyesilva TaxID=2991712 RepID=A0AA41YKW6_9PROT|nr:ABC transporter substrate-binding protein [Limobrevibacterium gyesilva]MCW3474480.1 ABC transporter substrate-binding protein [Limobrevibacterium gyesilva]